MLDRNLPWPSAATTSLDPVETPVDKKPAPLGVEPLEHEIGPKDCFRHSGWRADRRRIFDAMLRVSVGLSRIDSFARCGSSCWVLRHEDDHTKFRTVPDNCHDRFCVPCGGQRQAIIRRNLAEKLSDKPHRFLTLTIRTAGEPLETLLKRLYDGFRRLRSRVLWKHNVSGGAAFLELTYNDERQSWHPHLHCMLAGRYIDLRELKAAWLAATGDSHVVNIRIIRDRREITNYVTKYATKPLPAGVVHNADCLDEALRTLKGRRMILCFGSWRGWKLLEDPAEAGWELFEHLNAVAYRADHGDTLCANIIAMMHTADDATGEFVVVDDGPAPDT